MLNVMTVQQVVARAKEEGYPISEFSLRRWLRTGEVPCRMAGKKCLIYYPNLIAFLTCADTRSENSR